MAKSCSWARGVSTAVFLGGICGAGNGLHLAPRYRPRWPRVAAGHGCFYCSVPGGDLRRRQWSAPGIGLDGQELQLGPECFYCSVPGGDLRRRQRSAPGTGLDGQEWQMVPGYFCCSVPGGDLRRRQRSALGAQVSASVAKSGSWARVFLLQCSWGRSAAPATVSTWYRPRWPRVADGPGVFLLQCSWGRSAAPATVSAWRPGIGLGGQEWQLGPCVSAAVFLGEICGAGNGQHLVPASMAKSGSWPRGVSAAVFLGEICGAGNGQRLVPASMAAISVTPTAANRAIRRLRGICRLLSLFVRCESRALQQSRRPGRRLELLYRPYWPTS